MWRKLNSGDEWKRNGESGGSRDEKKEEGEKVSRPRIRKNENKVEEG